MKKIMMIAAFMVAALSASAQNEVGAISIKPTVGINFANITGDGDHKMKFGLIAGAEAEYGVAESFGLTAGLLYSMEGFKVDDEKSNLDYINIPILANYYIVPGLAIKAGIQPAFNVRHKWSYDGESGDIEGVNSFNFSVPVGLSYQISDFVIDARYNIGITKIFEDADQGRNSTITITLGYKIPF